LRGERISGHSKHDVLDLSSRTTLTEVEGQEKEVGQSRKIAKGTNIG
jgi:hypothetical protein